STKTGLPLLYRWDDKLDGGQLLTPGDEPIFPYAGAAAIHPSKPLVIFPKDKGGDVNYELYTLDYSKNVLEKITGPIGRIFYTFWISDDEWLVVGHEKETVYVKSLAMGSGGRDSPILSPSVYPERGFLAYSIDQRTHQELVVRSIETLEELYRMRIPGFGSMEWDTLSDLPEDLRKELEPLLDTWPENLNRRLREAGRPELQHRTVNGQTEFPPMLPADWYFCAQIVKTLPSQKVQYSEW